MTTTYFKTLIALLLTGISVIANRCHAQYTTWDQTPIITTADRGTFTLLFRSAESDTVRIAMFGDSQEEVRGGGRHYAPEVNLAFNDFYGNTPETSVIFSVNELNWLFSSLTDGASVIRSEESDLLPGQVLGTFDSSAQGLLVSLRTDADSTPFANDRNLREFDTRNVGIEIIGKNAIDSGEIAWRVNVQADDGVSFLGGTDIATGVTNLGLGNSDSGFATENIGSFQIPQSNDNIQVIATGSSQDGSQIAGVRFSNLDDPSGVAVQSFSLGGYTLRRLLDNHPGAEAAFGAMGDYDAVMIHLGTNDMFIFGSRDPDVWEASLIETITRLRDWAGNDDLPIIIAADPDSERGTPVLRDIYDQYPGVAAAVASSHNNVLALNSRRLVADELGWIAGTNTIIPFLNDEVHYTHLGAEELARLEVSVLTSLTEVLLADCNLDGVVDFSDPSALVTVLLSGVYLEEADCNLDGVIDFADIPAFIDILINL